MLKFVPPIFFGAGVTILLYGSKPNLPQHAYTTIIPFCAFVIYPFASFWKKSVLSTINKSQFPPQMKSYKEMLLVSRKAAVYELVLNQTIYHSLVGFFLLSYTYFLRTLYDKQTPRKSFVLFLKNTVWNFFQLRFFFATVGLFSQFWGSKMSLIKTNKGFEISSSMKRFLMMKELLLNMLWLASVSYLAHQNYQITSDGTQNIE